MTAINDDQGRSNCWNVMATIVWSLQNSHIQTCSVKRVTLEQAIFTMFEGYGYVRLPEYAKIFQYKNLKSTLTWQSVLKITTYSSRFTIELLVNRFERLKQLKAYGLRLQAEPWRHCRRWSA